MYRVKKKRLYANLKKCTFLTLKICFLGFVVLASEFLEGPEKVRAIEGAQHY